MQVFVLVVLIATLMAISHGFLVHNTRVASLATGSSTALNAHHVNKKITKRMMKRRPKKHRPSDITRNNQNMHKCITKLENAPSDYTLMTEDDYMKVREDSLKFWDNGDSASEWIEITAEDMDLQLVQSIEPLPEGGVQKKPPLLRSGMA